MPDTVIGIVSSTQFNSTFQTAFTQGLNDAGVTSGYTLDPKNADGSYDDAGAEDVHKKIHQYIKDFDKVNSGVKIFVAVGGLVAAHVALKKTKHKAFLVMVGGNPASDDFKLDQTQNPRYCGGIRLGTVESNEWRANALLTKFNTLAATDIALLYNPNSRTGRFELRSWRQTNIERRFAPAGIDDLELENTASYAAFKAGFDKITSGQNPAKAVVISADPFFAMQRNYLVQAANASGLKVCYPFDFYGTAMPPPDAGNSIWLGPKLEGAYRALGKKAGELFLAAGTGFPDQGTDDFDWTVTTSNPGTFPGPAHHPRTRPYAARRRKK